MRILSVCDSHKATQSSTSDHEVGYQLQPNDVSMLSSTESNHLIRSVYCTVRAYAAKEGNGLLTAGG